MRTTIPSRVKITCDTCKAEVNETEAVRVLLEFPILEPAQPPRFNTLTQKMLSVVKGIEEVAGDLCPSCYLTAAPLLGAKTL